MSANLAPLFLWVRDLPFELTWLVSDAEYAFVAALMNRANRRKRSRESWRAGLDAFAALRQSCSAVRPNKRTIVKLARMAERLFDRAKDLAASERRAAQFRATTNQERRPPSSK